MLCMPGLIRSDTEAQWRSSGRMWHHLLQRYLSKKELFVLGIFAHFSNNPRWLVVSIISVKLWKCSMPQIHFGVGWTEIPLWHPHHPVASSTHQHQAQEDGGQSGSSKKGRWPISSYPHSGLHLTHRLQSSYTIKPSVHSFHWWMVVAVPGSTFAHENKGDVGMVSKPSSMPPAHIPTTTRQISLASSFMELRMNDLDLVILVDRLVSVCSSTVLVHQYCTSTFDPLHYTSHYCATLHHLHVSLSNYLQEYIFNNDSVAL